MRKKIFCLVTNNENYYDIKLKCYEVQSQNKKNINKILNYKIMLNEIDDENTINMIQSDLAHLNFKKSKIIIGLHISNVFNERIRIPTLNFVDSRKTLDLELKKLYGNNIDQKYVYIKNKFRVNKNILDFYYTMCQRDIYLSLIRLFLNLQLKIEKVEYIPFLIKKFLVNKKIFNKKTFNMFININKSQTTIIVGKSNYFLTSSIIQLGTDKLKNELNIENLNDNSKSLNIQKKLEENLKFIFKTVVLELKKIIYSTQEEIENFYLNVEEIIFEKVIKISMEQSMNIKFSSVLLTDYENILMQCLQTRSKLLTSRDNLKFKVKMK